jgi:CRISPR-associated endonuclease/helicase Cas3
MLPKDFPNAFETLTGSSPFPWQTALYHRLIHGDFPSSASLPTGLGKTSIIAIWLCALVTEATPTAIPRRLVYVVNRRTVVDQTTTEVERIRVALKEKQELAEIRDNLAALSALPLPPDASPLAVSTLRGQLADNGAWCADPTRPAVIVGTVDMIGSGLLFSRYTRGFKTRPLYAGFLGQDALLVHDEAHLEPAFQTLLESIVASQNAGKDPRPLRIIALTATNRSASDANPFGLDENPDDKDSDHPIVQKRIHAFKRLSLVALGEGDKLGDRLVALAKARPEGRAILIFARSVETAMKVATELDKGAYKRKVALLTGTMRGQERDDLVAKNPVFQCFLASKDRAKNVEPASGTVFLVATSAGEVGVNFSADDLVCDLSTYESMAQRFGRVNRFGEFDDTEIIVVHETDFDTKKPLEAARERTVALLNDLGDSASPAALAALPADARAAAFSPPPTLRVTTDIQFDAWAFTSIRESISARPPIAPYLHGEAEWQPRETYLAWRDDPDFTHVEDPESFLDEFPLRPVELLRDSTTRIVKTLAALLEKREAESAPLPRAWLITETGAVRQFSLSNFDKDAAEVALADATLILPTSLGGLDEKGIFSASATHPAIDCSGIERRESDSREDADFCVDISDEDADEPRYLLWFAPAAELPLPRKKANGAPETLETHTNAVVANASAIAAKVFPSALHAGEPDLGRCLVAAAHLHDLGKNRLQWQRNLGNFAYDPAKPDTILAKANGTTRPRNVAEHYRHEFGSLLDAINAPAFANLTEAEREIALHLIAAHHGRARPYFPTEEAFDYSSNITSADTTAAETPSRFARLQKHFGRWGLAWLESLLRAADYAASAGIVTQAIPLQNNITTTFLGAAETRIDVSPKPSATLALNPSNPGHYFACCGLFELASRLSSNSLAWFEQVDVGFQFHLANTPSLVDLLKMITAAEITALDPEDPTASRIFIGNPFDLRIDWWKTASEHTAALKVWAGKMEAPRIARAMQKAIRPEDGEKILFNLRIAYLPEDPTKKVEPFYFDANRGPNSDARDVGFSTNDLGLESLAAPAAEFLTMVGLQRAIPQPAGDRIFDYRLWHTPTPVSLLAAAINGCTETRPSQVFRFESWYRTSQRKHKAFLPATPL